MSNDIEHLFYVFSGYLYVFCYLQNIIQMGSYSILQFKSGFFPFNVIILRPIQVVACIDSLLLLVAGQYSMAWMHHSLLNHLPIDIHYVIFWDWLFFPTHHNALEIHVSCVYQKIISSAWLLQIKLLWTFVHRILCRHIFSFLQGKCLGVELLGHTIHVCLVFQKKENLFQGGCTIFTFLPAMYDRSIFSSVLSALCILSFYFSCPNRCVEISHQNHNLHFPNG